MPRIRAGCPERNTALILPFSSEVPGHMGQVPVLTSSRSATWKRLYLEIWVSSGDPGKCVRWRQGTTWLGVSGDWRDWPGWFHVVMETS